MNLLTERLILRPIELANAGVIEPVYAIFQNHSYMGLCGGLKAKGIHKKEGLKNEPKHSRPNG